MSASTPLTLFRGASPHNSYVWSPFVTKLEARLRFASVPYTLGAGSPRSAPRGKIPYIEMDGRQMGDTTLIIRDLTQRGVIAQQNTSNVSLTRLQRAQDLAIRALLEDKVYFYGGREKWCDNYGTMVEGVLGIVPWFLRWFVGILAYRKNVRTLAGQGTGLLSGEEIAYFRAEAWEAVDAMLTEARTVSREPFWVLGGDEPTEADATLYGFIIGSLVCTA